MAKYVYIYHGTNTAPPTPEMMQAWSEWLAGLGDKLTDAGSPLAGPNKGVLRGGKAEKAADSVIGYAAVDASSLDEAMDMAKGNPLASAEGCEVRVYEAGQM